MALSPAVPGLAALAMVYSVAIMHPALMRACDTRVRLSLVLPLIFLFVAAPFAIPLTSGTARGICTCVVSWVMSFKLLAVVLRQGTLLKEKNPFVFMVKLVLPVLEVAHRGDGRPRHPPQSALQSFLKCAIALCTMTAMIPLLHGYVVAKTWNPPVPIQLLLETMYLMQFIEIVLASQCLLATVVFGISVSPGTRFPLLSTSIKEFWSFRWNLAVSAVLRDVCYLPLVAWSSHTHEKADQDECSSDDSTSKHVDVPPYRAAEAKQRTHVNVSTTSAHAHSSASQSSSKRSLMIRKRVGMVLAFIVSGAAHEWALSIVVGSRSKWYSFFGFFLVQPLLIWGQESLFSTSAWKRLATNTPVLAKSLGWLTTATCLFSICLALFRYPMYSVFEFVTRDHYHLCVQFLPNIACTWPQGILWDRELSLIQ